MFSAKFLVFLTSAVILVKAVKTVASVKCLCEYKSEDFKGFQADTSCLATAGIAQQTKSCDSSSSSQECGNHDPRVPCTQSSAFSVSGEPIKLVSGTKIYENGCGEPGATCSLPDAYCDYNYNNVSLYGASLWTGKCDYYTFPQCCGCRCSTTAPISFG
ncbi:Uncharacterised protein g2462 [Pycnogonum litorale]